MSKSKRARRSRENLLDRLEEAKKRVGEIDPAQLEKLLKVVAQQKFADALSLARFHEALLFLRAYPPNRAVLGMAESLLQTFSQRIAQLRKEGADFSSIDNEEFSGIVGTTLTSILNFEETRWLVKRFPESVSIDWEGYDKKGQMAASLPRFIPLLEEDSFVEPDVPYLQWMREASRGHELDWLIRQCERSSLSTQEKAEIFDGLELPIRWELGNSSATRTLARYPVRQIHYQSRPMIKRNEVSLIQEISLPPLKVNKLSRREGNKIITFCREAMTVRCRELYGTTLGDPSHVLHASVGRGVEIFLWGLSAERRLPLRVYQAGLALKNGIPVNYIEAISLFEWMEIGYNVFYNFRDGESAWIYAQTLRLLHQLLGVTCVSVYPYQIGQDNEEAIKSGAFWFYRKMGFRPMRRELARIMEAEEKKIAANRSYRTSQATLRRLAKGHLVFELPGTAVGQWDNFHIRNIGFAVQRRMAERFGGDPEKIRHAARNLIAYALDIRLSRLSEIQLRACENYALVLSLVPDLARWTKAEREMLREIIRAKGGSSELRYAQLLLRHARLRATFLKIGSGEEL